MPGDAAETGGRPAAGRSKARAGFPDGADPVDFSLTFGTVLEAAIGTNEGKRSCERPAGRP